MFTLVSQDHIGTVLRRWHQGRTLLLAATAVCVSLIQSSLQAADPVSFKVGAFTFERPEGWNWVVPTSSMRKAELSVPGEAGAAEVTFFHFGPGQGGGVQANVERWLGQFGEEGKKNHGSETFEEAGIKVTIVITEGTFASGMPGGPTTPMQHFALRGAILEHADGDVFVKMTGPKTTIEGASVAFDTMVRQACATVAK